MAELHDLKPAKGSHRTRKRVGRGPGSGTGKTAGRGENGQLSRSGASVRAGFEGGQMPLQRRIPKRGFHNRNRVEYQVVNLRDLERLGSSDVTVDALRAGGLIGSKRLPVKVLGQGDVTQPLNVTVHAFSNSARTKIEAAGGSVSVIGEQGGQ